VVKIRKANAGFTYVWVLLAVALTSALLAAAVQSASQRTMRERQLEHAWILEQYRIAMLSYQQLGTASNPAPLESLERLVRDERGGVVRRHLRQLYPNPMTGQVDWSIQYGPAGEPIGVAAPILR
jgi:type II secretory pathway pseudopilin PulG